MEWVSLCFAVKDDVSHVHMHSIQNGMESCCSLLLYFQLFQKVSICVMLYFVGLVIVMSESLSDDSVFSLLMVGTVWQIDQFYSIYCKQKSSKMFLPWSVTVLGYW